MLIQTRTTSFKIQNPLTNGGLLIAVSPQSVEEVKAILVQNGYADFTEPIGKMMEAGEKSIVVS